MSMVIGLDLGEKQNVAVVFESDGTEHAAASAQNSHCLPTQTVFIRE
ncbi:MAG: hypothetical protein ACI9X0_001449 [Kiritimatiellia bacterium]|jgi:hypothetical protein